MSDEMTSAPVGVEAANCYTCGNPRHEGRPCASPKWATPKMCDQLLARALKAERLLELGQPATVDEAMERLRTHRNWMLWQADLVGGQISMDRMRAILTAALAAQQGGRR